jgi:ankyrin repeat protein
MKLLYSIYLSLAINNKRDDLVQALLFAGANPNIETENQPIFSATAYGGTLHALRLLLEHRANASDI